jgi:hypothetical protein
MNQFHVARWFGVASYRKLKVTVEVRRRLCPICQHELEKLRYSGREPVIVTCYGSSRGYGEKMGFLADAFEGGCLVCEVEVSDGWKDFG